MTARWRWPPAHANVLVTHTFSKIYGLAGERIGWGTGDAELVEALNRIRGPFNLTATAQAAALAAAGGSGVLWNIRRSHNAQERGALCRRDRSAGQSRSALRAERGQFRAGAVRRRVTAEAARDGIEQAGYAVRHLPGQGLPQALRITIGTSAQMDAIADAIRTAVERREMSFQRVAIIGLGLIGGSIGLAVAEHLPGVVTSGYDADPAARAKASARGLADSVCDSAAEAVADADLVILCVPVGAMAAAAAEIAPHLAAGVVVSDVGSSKRSVATALAAALPGVCVIPAHPVAGTEKIGAGCGLCQPVPQPLVHRHPAARSAAAASSPRLPPSGKHWAPRSN